MDYQGSGQRGQPKGEHGVDIQEVRVGCESCGALLSVGIPGSHPADTPVIVRCGNCRRLLEVQLTAPAQLPDSINAINRHTQALQREKQQQHEQLQRQHQLLSQGRHANPFLQPGAFSGASSLAVGGRSPGLASHERFAAPGVGLKRFANVTPADLTRLAQNSVGFQEPGFGSMGSRSQQPRWPSLHSPGWAGGQRLPGQGSQLGLTGNFLDQLSAGPWTRIGTPPLQSSQAQGLARAYNDPTSLTRQHYMQQNPQGFSDVRQHFSHDGRVQQMPSPMLKRMRESDELAEGSRRILGMTPNGTSLREPAPHPKGRQDHPEEGGGIIRLGELARQAEEAAARDVSGLGGLGTPSSRQLGHGVSQGGMGFHDQRPSQVPHSFYMRKGEPQSHHLQQLQQQAMQQRLQAGDMGLRQPPMLDAYKEDEQKWDAIGAGEKPVEVPKFQSMHDGLDVWREEADEVEAQQQREGSHERWLRHAPSNTTAAANRLQDHETWIRTPPPEAAEDVAPAPHSATEDVQRAAGMQNLAETHQAPAFDQSQQPGTGGDGEHGSPGSPLGSSILQHHILLDMSDQDAGPQDGLTHEPGQDSEGKDGPESSYGKEKLGGEENGAGATAPCSPGADTPASEQGAGTLAVQGDQSGFNGQEQRDLDKQNQAKRGPQEGSRIEVLGGVHPALLHQALEAKLGKASSL